MEAPIHVKEDESMMPRIIAVVGGLVILGVVVGGFVAFSGAWAPPATTSMAHTTQAGS